MTDYQVKYLRELAAQQSDMVPSDNLHDDLYVENKVAIALYDAAAEIERYETALSRIANLAPVLMPQQLVDRFIEVRLLARQALDSTTLPPDCISSLLRYPTHDASGKRIDGYGNPAKGEYNAFLGDDESDIPCD